MHFLGWQRGWLGMGTGTRCGAGGSGVAKPCPEPPGSLFPCEETRELLGAVAELSPSRAVSLFAGLSVTNARLASGIFTSPSVSGASAFQHPLEVRDKEQEPRVGHPQHVYSNPPHPPQPQSTSWVPTKTQGLCFV